MEARDMPEASAPPLDDSYLKKVIEAVVRVGLVLLLFLWCFNIIRPFITPVVWGVILAVAVFPAYRWLTAKLAGRGKLAAVILTLLGFSVVLVPAMLFAGSLIESGQQITQQQDIDSIHVPPPPAAVKDWPLIGGSVHELWSQANHSLEPLVVKFTPQLRAAAKWLIGATVGTGVAIAQSLLSIIIAGVMLVGASGGAQAATTLSKRLVGASGDKFIQMAARTIRSVAVGIVGVAIIQSGLIGVGMLAAGVPHAGVWSLLCLILAILQLPPLLVVAPIIAYVFSNASTPIAVAFTIWEVAASMSDSFLKPILLARGVEVPMLVIFLGAIGGFMMSGFIGLFVGAVVLSLGYELARAWIREEADTAEAAAEGAAE
jgi:predicted PurR-regulated permease PerM